MEILVGALIGLAIGTTGVGGGTLMAPVLILLQGFPPRAAVVPFILTGLAVGLVGSLLFFFNLCRIRLWMCPRCRATSPG